MIFGKPRPADPLPLVNIVACKLAAAFVAAAAASGITHAQCPTMPATPPAADVLPQVVQTLEAEWERCLRDGPYLAYFGVVRLAQGKPEEAAALLERAMLMAPWLTSARLDYAEALAALGDRRAARAWLDDVLRHDNPPPVVADRIRNRLQALSTPMWTSTARLAVKAGYDNNVFLSPRASTISLTFPSGEILFPLETRYQSAGSAVLQTEAMVAARRVPADADDGVLSIVGEARLRNPVSMSGARYTETSIGGVWEQPFGATPTNTGNDNGNGNGRYTAIGGLSASVVTLHTDTLLRSYRVMGGAATPWTCQPRAIVEWEHREYPLTPALDGRYAGVAISGFCPYNGAGGLTLGVRFGSDRPSGLRAGGAQARAEAHVGWQQAIYGGRLEADIWVTRLKDESTYSPLLSFGATRRITRKVMRMEYAYPIAASWEALGSVERITQRSNLDLFSLSGTTVMLGVRKTFGW